MLVPTSGAAAAGCANQHSLSLLLSQEAIEGSLACLINEQRAAHGVRPVGSNPSLRAAGLKHSSDMVSQGFFGHTSPDGGTFSDRIEATGYTRGARSWVVGENLVWGLGSGSTPSAMVSNWMNSPPHRENLLRARFHEIGIAAVRGTPQGISNPLGITVSSEYGYRGGKGGKRKKKSRKAKKSKLRQRHH
jgi:uncharacterized protein YkwD